MKLTVPIKRKSALPTPLAQAALLLPLSWAFSAVHSDQRFVFLPTNETEEGTFTIVADDGWAASSNAEWITIETPSGSGGNLLHYTAEANEAGRLRVGEIEVNGETYSVVQGQFGSYAYGMGPNSFGQLLGNGSRSATLDLVKIMDGVIDAYRGLEFTVYLKDDGSLWGISQKGFDSEGGNQLATPEIVLLEEGVASVRASSGAFYYIKTNGDLYVNRLGGPELITSNVVKVCPGAYDSYLYLTSDGLLYGYRPTQFAGDLGIGTATAPDYPVLIAADVKDAALGWFFSAFVTEDGKLWASGASWSGIFDPSVTQNALSPINVGSGVVAIEASSKQIAMLKEDGHLYLFGGHEGHLFPPEANEPSYTFDEAIRIAENVAEFSFADDYNGQLFFREEDGESYVLGGHNLNGQFGVGTVSQWSRTPVRLPDNVVRYSGNADSALHVKSDNTVWAAGARLDRVIGSSYGVPPEERAPVAIVLDDVTQYSIGEQTAYFLNADGRLELAGVGLDEAGQSAVFAERTLVDTDVVVFDPLDVVSSGIAYVKSDGSLWLHGMKYGALEMESPVQPSRVTTGAVGVALSGNAVFWTTSEGELYGIGSQIGPNNPSLSIAAISSSINPIAGSLANFSSPEYLETIHLLANNVEEVHASYDTLFYLTGSGALWSLGSNDFGLRGVGGSPNPSVATQVATGVERFILDGHGVTAFYQQAGTGLVYGWGANYYDQLGPIGLNVASPTLAVFGSIPDFAAHNSLAAVFPDRTLWYRGLSFSDSSSLGFTPLANDVDAVFAGQRTVVFKTPNPVLPRESVWGVEANPRGGPLEIDIAVHAEWVGFAGSGWLELDPEAKRGVGENSAIVLVEPNYTSSVRSSFVSLGGAVVTVFQRSFDVLRYALRSDDATNESDYLPKATFDRDAIGIRFRRSREDVRYVVEVSSDLVDWSELVANPGAVGELVEVKELLPSTSSRLFLRLSLTMTD